MQSNTDRDALQKRPQNSQVLKSDGIPCRPLNLGSLNAAHLTTINNFRRRLKEIKDAFEATYYSIKPTHDNPPPMLPKGYELFSLPVNIPF
jgi:hypothetical protein